MQARVIVRNMTYDEFCFSVRDTDVQKPLFKLFVLLEIHMINVIITAHCTVHNHAGQSARITGDIRQRFVGRIAAVQKIQQNRFAVVYYVV